MSTRITGLPGNLKLENGILSVKWVYMNREVAYREILRFANKDKTFRLI